MHKKSVFMHRHALKTDACMHICRCIFTANISDTEGHCSYGFSVKQIGHTPCCVRACNLNRLIYVWHSSWEWTWGSVAQATECPQCDAMFNEVCVWCIRITLWKEMCIPYTFPLVNEWQRDMYMQTGSQVLWLWDSVCRPVLVDSGALTIISARAPTLSLQQ